jgi:hypothetical protein
VIAKGKDKGDGSQKLSLVIGMQDCPFHPNIRSPAALYIGEIAARPANKEYFSATEGHVT